MYTTTTDTTGTTANTWFGRINNRSLRSEPSSHRDVRVPDRLPHDGLHVEGKITPWASTCGLLSITVDNNQCQHSIQADIATWGGVIGPVMLTRQGSCQFLLNHVLVLTVHGIIIYQSGVGRSITLTGSSRHRKRRT